MGSFEWDLAEDVLYFSDEAARIFGARAGAWPAQRGEILYSRLSPLDREAVREEVSNTLRKGRPLEIEHRALRKSDGREIWVFTAGWPVMGPEGELQRVLGVSQDISERKAAEAQRETLVAELDHRVKNVLASVQSLALQSARKASSLDGFLKTFAGRLKSMASAHTLLTATRWRGAALRFIVAAELGGLAPGQTRWEGPEDLVLTPRATNALSLALHELATNAVKFGALSTDRGQVDVRWRLRRDGGFELQWLESGGPPVSPRSRNGFGSTLLEKVTGRELNGEARVEYLPGGVRAIIGGDKSVIVPSVPPGLEPVVQPPASPKIEGASTGDGARSRAGKIKGLRLMIVEDALLLSLELEAGLTEAGAKVVAQAADVEEALRMMETQIDAAVLDANLNGQSVAPVAEALQARGVPFIFATGYGDNQAGPQGFDAPTIRKPYDVTQVAAALAEVTGRA